MEEVTMDNLGKINLMEKELIHILMEKYIKEDLKMVKNMEKERLKFLIKELTKVFGIWM